MVILCPIMGATSKAYQRFSFITLILIFLVIIAGSVVRTTGSGMGCPDWPKCFGNWVPPTCDCQLPDNYKETYSEYRKNKVEKFAKFLASIGFEEDAQAILNDPNLLIEQDFNATKTWFEYGNRLVGFLAGNAVLILFLWTLFRYRKRRLLLGLTFFSLILIGLNAWFGSIVVATNLIAWTITIHMFLALLSVGIQVKIIQIAKGNELLKISVSKLFYYLFLLALIFTFYQILMGSQVRQIVDGMVKEGVDRAVWIDQMSLDFYFHRTFSWVVLALNGYLLWLAKKNGWAVKAMYWVLGIILFEFLTGVLFSYAGMPAAIQPTHLLAAALLITIQFYQFSRFKKKMN